AVLHRVIHDTPRPMHEISPEIPDWLEAIIAKLHAKDPALRFQSAREVADLLGQHLAHLQEPRRVSRPAPVVPPQSGEPTSARIEKLLEATDRRRRMVQHAGVALGLLLGTIGIGVMVMDWSGAATGVVLFLVG